MTPATHLANIACRAYPRLAARLLPRYKPEARNLQWAEDALEAEENATTAAFTAAMTAGQHFCECGTRLDTGTGIAKCPLCPERKTA